MKSALELIAGPQEELQVLPFDESTILDEFQNLLVNFFDGDDDKVVFTDLFEVAPFNQAMLAKRKSFLKSCLFWHQFGNAT